MLTKNIEAIKNLKDFKQRSNERNKECKESLKIDSRKWLITIKDANRNGDGKDE